MSINEINKITSATVIKIYRTFLLLETFNKEMCRLNLKEVSDYYVGDLEDIFRVGELVNVLILDYDESKKTYIVSFKRIHAKFLRNPFEFNFDKNESDFKKLLKFTKRKIKNDK